MANVAAEKVLLASLLAHPSKLFEYTDHLAESDFSVAATRMTFEVVRSLVIDKETEKLTKAKLVSEAKSLGHHNYLSVTRDGQWIDELFEESSNIVANEVDDHFTAVKRQTVIDGYKDAFDEMRDYITATNEPLSSMIARVEDAVVKNVTLLDHGENQVISLVEGIWDYIEELADDPGHIGLDLGYPVWQERIGQIRNGAVTFVVATAKAGKSQFATKAAFNAAWKHNLPVLVLDSELNERDQRIRLVGMAAKVPYQYIETGFWKMSVEQLKERGVTDPQVLMDIQGAGRRMRDLALRS
jgi:replicative DNA helicase